MKERNNSTSSRLPMIEIVIIISILAIISVYIMRLFLFANSLQTDAVNTSKAVILSESIAEVLKSSESFETTLLEYGLEKKEDMDNIYIMYFDNNWVEVLQAGSYAIEVKVDIEKEGIGFMEIANITAYQVILNDNNELSNQDNQKIWCNIIVKKFQNLKKT